MLLDGIGWNWDGSLVNLGTGFFHLLMFDGQQMDEIFTIFRFLYDLMGRGLI
jgi:hypothetical protein